MCGDARNWDEDAYRESILKEREIQTRTVFRTVWAPAQNPNPNPETIVAASSDGSIASYSISSCISKLVSSLYLFIYFYFFLSPHFSRIQSNFASNLIDILFSFFPSLTLFVLTGKWFYFCLQLWKISKNAFVVVWSAQKIINISWYSK